MTKGRARQGPGGNAIRVNRRLTSVETLTALALGGLLSVFSYSSPWPIPLASWLAPVFLLRVARIPSPWGLAAVWLVSLLAVMASHRGVINVPGPVYPVLVLLSVGPWVLPYFADRWLTPRLGGFIGTLVFPSTWTIMELALSGVSPYGAWGSVAYTQYGNVPLMQLASVTGLWGITFLVLWFASVVNWAWASEFQWSGIRVGFLTYTTIWILVMSFGAARVWLAPTPATVRMAGIGLPEGVIGLDQRMSAYEPSLPSTEREAKSQMLHPLHDRLFAETLREARAGAKVIVWHETAAPVFVENEAALLERGQRLASEQNIYLLMTLGTIHEGPAPHAQNKAVLVTPSGETAFEYVKSRPLPGQESDLSRPGDGQLRFENTPYGRLTVAICSDLDYPFPPLARQAGRSRADILLVPASDWERIKYLHPHQAAFHAVANGVAVVRPNRYGVSMSFDRYGRPLATVDEFASTNRNMVAYVPTRGGPTLYSWLGEWFGWMCGLGAVLLIGFGRTRPVDHSISRSGTLRSDSKGGSSPGQVAPEGPQFMRRALLLATITAGSLPCPAPLHSPARARSWRPGSSP